MAHDFRISIKGSNEREAWFYGYGKGFLYKAFDAWDRNAIVSGNGTTKTLNIKQAKAKLKKAIEAFDSLNYPDPNRADELKEFYCNVLLDAQENERVVLYFG
jgi:hypothetical protein